MSTQTTERPWYHTIELPDGTATPGWYDTRPAPSHVEWPARLKGGRCLDVGTFDGFWAFEMERRGAREVVALDVDDPDELDWHFDDEESGPELVRSWSSERGPGFRTAAELLDSQVERVNCNVYDLHPDRVGTFDVVFCGALLLHLRDPVRALNAMRRVVGEGGELVLVEALNPTLDVLARGIPAARFSPDWDQWWMVNAAGLNAIVHKAGFEPTWSSKRFLLPFGPAVKANLKSSRMHGIAVGKPRAQGLLHLAMKARPRPRQPTRR